MRMGRRPRVSERPAKTDGEIAWKTLTWVLAGASRGFCCGMHLQVDGEREVDPLRWDAEACADLRYGWDEDVA